MPGLQELRRLLTWRTGNRKNPGPQDEPVSSAHMPDILTAHDALRTKIENAARNGAVADALALSLYGNHAEQLAEWRRLYAEERLGFEARLHRLNAMFPEPPSPAPEPPPPQYFPRLGNLLAERSCSRIH